MEALGVFRACEVSILPAPTRNRVHHPPDHLAYAMFTLRASQRPSEILRNHHVGRHLRPSFGNFNTVLFKDDFALFICNRGGTLLPLEFIIGIHPRMGKISRY